MLKCTAVRSNNILTVNQFFSFCVHVLDAEQQTDTSYNPLCRFLLGFEVEGPDIGGPSQARLIHRALVNILSLLLLHKNSFDEHDGDFGSKLLQSRLLDEASLSVPACAFHKEAVNVCPLSGGAAEVLFGFLRHVTLKTHLVQWPLILASHGLHDGSEEGLGVEKTSQPDTSWHGEIRDPGVKFSDSHEEVHVPGCQAVHGGVRSLGPAVRHAVKEERVFEALHISRESQLTLKK